MESLLLKKISWAVTWDPTRSKHVYARNVDIAVENGEITFIGQDAPLSAERIIDGANKLMVPGFVNIHCHPDTEPLSKGLMEEQASPKLGMSAMYEYMHLVRPDEATRRAATLFCIAELIRSGVTTFVDLSTPRDSWLDDLAMTGIRSVVAPMFVSATAKTLNGHSVDYEWNEIQAFDHLAEALEIIDAARSHHSGLLDGMLAPMRVDTSSEKLVQSSLEEARKRAIPMQIHTGQSLVEFTEMTRRYGMTPVEWLESIECLDEQVILGHCIFLDDHPWVKWPYRLDLSRISRSGASVAHCPVIFARKGIVLNSFPRYIKNWINVGLGTDTSPHNFLDEMRWALVLGKVAEGSIIEGSTAELLNAATVNGASALHRNDLGRIETGAKADFFLVDLKHPTMHPLKDPLKNLFFSALERPITDVFINGRPVIKDGAFQTFCVDELPELLTRGQEEALRKIPDLDYAGRAVDEIFPMALHQVSYPESGDRSQK